MVEHKHDHQPKDVKGDRHTTRQEHGQAYGGSPVKKGAGKYNWGGSNSEEVVGTMDAKDPMYDSGPDKAGPKTAKVTAPSSPIAGGTTGADGEAAGAKGSCDGSG
eukprot:GHVS01087695.1.p2 GENE.GHVS01087695.1~~GHVS01087695.1.p2  ORF type:complete len:105 (+),score=25.94 GHVS01087695.1:234-548(+)